MNRYFEFIEEFNNNLIPCYFKSMTSIDCPGCGLQSAFILLLKGDIVSSIQLYPALIPLMLSFFFFLYNFFSPRKVLDRVFKYLILLSSFLIVLNYGLKWYRLELF